MKYLRRIALATLLACSVAVQTATTQTLPAGPQVLTFHSDVDDTDQPYAVYLPEGFDASKKYPLVVSLHGAGSNHRLNLRRVFGKSNTADENDVEASRYFPDWKGVDFIVASPYARGTMGYQGVAEKDVLDVLEDVKRRFPIDANRVYLTGLSMGGGGTLWLGLTHPDLWAALAPVCPAAPPETGGFAANALNLPVRVSQGGADPVVKPEDVRAWVERLREAGGKVEYEEFPDVGHNSWENAYADGRVFEWFSQFRRDPHPERVRLATDRYRYNHAYWVTIDALTPGEPARIEAGFDDVNRIEATTSGLDAFTLNLEGHPRHRSDQPIQILVDGQDLTAPPAEAVSLVRRDGSWASGSYVHSESEKRAGLEGPMSEVVASRHIYVFGTGGDPAKEELDSRRRLAEEAANWSVYRGWFWGRIMVFPRVVSDDDVRPSDLEEANLVLFGTRETNKLIARFADQLPLHLEKGSGDFGLVYVYPVGGRYSLISSGVPWWKWTGGSNRFAQGVVAFGLAGPDDFRLFRAGDPEPVAAGRFDRHWRLPAEAIERMRATGVVRVADLKVAKP